MSDNRLNNAAIKYLARGQWPDLRQLYLGTNAFDAGGIEHSMKAKWPNLDCLELDVKLVHAITWELLKLKPGTLADDTAKNGLSKPNSVPKVKPWTPENPFRWLDWVDFVNQETTRLTDGSRPKHPSIADDTSWD